MLLDNEKELIKRFRETRIPLIFKIDKTDNILYIEHVDFDLCNMLLKGKKVNVDCLQNEIELFANFLAQISILDFNEEEKNYFKLLIEIVSMFIKENL